MTGTQVFFILTPLPTLGVRIRRNNGNKHVKFIKTNTKFVDENGKVTNEIC